MFTQVPVFKGAPLPIVDVNPDFLRNWRPFFGADGFGCAEYDSAPALSLIKDENAIVALNRIVSENEGKSNISISNYLKQKISFCN